MRLRIALDGLVPIAFCEMLARDYGEAETAEDLIPPRDVREKLVETLCMADTLVAGGAVTPSQHADRGKALGATAKAIAALACCPGGVKCFGSHWRVVPNRRGRFDLGSLVQEGCEVGPPRLPGRDALARDFT